MANKVGFLQKCKVALYLFGNPSRKHILTVSCEFCGSTNIAAHHKNFSEGTAGRKILKEYRAEYLCMNCKATCRCEQSWTRYPDKVIEELKKILRGDTN